MESRGIAAGICEIGSHILGILLLDEQLSTQCAHYFGQAWYAERNYPVSEPSVRLCWRRLGRMTMTCQYDFLLSLPLTLLAERPTACIQVLWIASERALTSHKQGRRKIIQKNRDQKRKVNKTRKPKKVGQTKSQGGRGTSCFPGYGSRWKFPAAPSREIRAFGNAPKGAPRLTTHASLGRVDDDSPGVQSSMRLVG